MDEIMADDNLRARLGKLQDILGKKITLDLSGRSDRVIPGNRETQVPSWEDEHFDLKMRQYETSNDYGAETATYMANPIKSPGTYKDIDSATLKIGQSVDDEISFCPWHAVVHYPARFIGKANKPRAQPFFDRVLEGKTWDFFYLHNPAEPEQKPCLLVPTAQFVGFLEGVNQILTTNLVIPGGPNKRLFDLHFGVGGTPRPRHLLRSRDQKKLHIDEWPAANEEDLRAYQDAADVHRELWLSEWEKTKQHSFPDNRGGSYRAEKKREARLQMLSQTQLFLGLQGARDPPGKPVTFICVDIEAIEVAPNPVSEIGIAVLNSEHLKGIAAGPSGANWWDFIEAHHVRVKEYAGLVNYRFVQGCPNNFDFGTSVFPRRAELVDTLNATFAKYANGTHDVVLVGHDIKSDIKYLSTIGFPIDQLPGLIGNVDTQAIYRAWKDGTKSPSLGSVLVDLDIRYKNLHNAGNDAVYTLRAMVAIAVVGLHSEQDAQLLEPSLQ
ncbi:QDE-2-interacting protein [Metarhizium guizhouense ARSEF 977]|uniref:QDE-2-interacting protein n=1 Tax=Metarhizium guizhouense (strain ARSEF 977) TaxID=1276136 RepID=A0A0B4GX64_METGA|nr:QDE-2-interacting protein [Metarhizium guizhouense ARSEF 977]